MKKIGFSTFKSVIAFIISAAILLGSTWASAGNVPSWSGGTTTNQPRQIRQPRKPLVSEPKVIPAQTVQQQQPRYRTAPSTTSNSTVSTPVQQRESLPKAGIGEAETPMSIAQDECVLSYSIKNPTYYGYYSGSSSTGTSPFGNTGPFGFAGTNFMPSAEEAAAILAAGYSTDPFITSYVVLEKGDYQIMYLPEILYIANFNRNNSVDFLVRLPGINMVGTGPDDWTKGKKSRFTLRPGESAQFDEGSATTLIKVRCP